MLTFAPSWCAPDLFSGTAVTAVTAAETMRALLSLERSTSFATNVTKLSSDVMNGSPEATQGVQMRIVATKA